VEIFAVLFLFAHACPAQQNIPGTEKALFEAVNRERAARHLTPLRWDEGLARAARKHAKQMAEQDLLEHQVPGEPDLPTRAREAGASFSHITENIGMAVDADSFHDGWMHSPGHRENILDPAADSIGIAVAEGTEELYAVEDFARSVKPLSLEEQEKQVGKLLVARGLHLLKTKNEARKTCELDQEPSESSKPRYIAHYETPNISMLPERLEKEIQTGRYKSAAVAACARKESEIAQFRIVVLLY
jgi:hypothetical protein